MNKTLMSGHFNFKKRKRYLDFLKNQNPDYELDLLYLRWKLLDFILPLLYYFSHHVI